MKQPRRILASMLALLLVSGLFLLPAHAAGVNVQVNGVTLSGAQLIGGTTYVPFKNFCQMMGASASVSGGAISLPTAATSTPAQPLRSSKSAEH